MLIYKHTHACDSSTNFTQLLLAFFTRYLRLQKKACRLRANSVVLTTTKPQQPVTKEINLLFSLYCVLNSLYWQVNRIMWFHIGELSVCIWACLCTYEYVFMYIVYVYENMLESICAKPHNIAAVTSCGMCVRDSVKSAKENDCQPQLHFSICI